MSWTICFWLTVGVIALTVGQILISKVFGKRIGRISVLHRLIIGTFLCTTILHIPVYLYAYNGTAFCNFRALILSIHGVIGFFVVDTDYGFLVEVVTEAAGALTNAYIFLFTVLILLCPVFTFGFILSFFKNISARLSLASKFFRNQYIFSELNEKSILLAKDIKQKDRRRVVVFCDVFEGGDEQEFELLEEARKIGAICFKNDILNIFFRFHSKRKALFFFVIGSDESENMSQTMQIVQNYSDVDNTHLYLFSGSTESRLLVSGMKRDKIRIRRIDDALALVNREMYDHGAELFESAIPMEGSDEKKISAVVVGLGRYGTEMLRTLVWFSQMTGYRAYLYGFDRDPDSKDRFRAVCPEIMSERYNGIYREGEAQYKIEVHSGVSTENERFADILRQIGELTYVFVSLGSDEENIRAAVRIRMLAEQMHVKPIIKAVVHSRTLSQSLATMKNFKNQPYDIDFVGDLESAYSEDTILNSRLEADALSRHLKWGAEEEFWRYEYNYRSSTASAIHMKARLACGVAGAGKKEEELTEEDIAVLEPLEHRRWNAYMRSQGYIYSGSPDKSSRNDLGKMHHDLVDFEDLSEEDKRKDRTVGSR